MADVRKKIHARPIRIRRKRRSTRRILSTWPSYTSSFPSESVFVLFVDHTEILEIPTGARKPGTGFRRVNESPRFRNSAIVRYLENCTNTLYPYTGPYTLSQTNPFRVVWAGWPHRIFRWANRDQWDRGGLFWFVSTYRSRYRVLLNNARTISNGHRTEYESNLTFRATKKKKEKKRLTLRGIPFFEIRSNLKLDLLFVPPWFDTTYISILGIPM